MQFRSHSLVLAAAIVLAMHACVFAQTTAPEKTADLRVMTFNIRVDLKEDGDNDWSHRRELWTKTVRAFDPDLLGLQEVTPGQADDIRKALDDYAMIGASCDGEKRGEASSLLFRKDRFERINDGLFWLSATPDVPASIGWDAKYPRVVTWAELHDRRADEKHARLFYFNTHWDHIGEDARQESAALMRQRIGQIAVGAPVIVTGDFNCSDNSKAYHLFTGPRDDAGNVHLIDSYRELHPKRVPSDFTFHGFSGTNSAIARIDWILHTADFQAMRCEIDDTNAQGHYPSDHFPVIAILQPAERAPASAPISRP